MAETAQLELDLAEALAANRAELHGDSLETRLPVEEPNPPVAAPEPSAASDVKDPVAGHAPVAPASDTHPDLSWAPEDCRAEFAKLSQPVLAKVKSAFHGAQDYTRKTQALADARSAFDTERMDSQDDARLGYKVRNIPELNQLVTDWIASKARGQKPSAEEDIPDLFNMAPDEARAALASWQKRVLEQAKEAGAQGIYEKYVQPLESERAYGKAIADEFVVRRGVPEAVAYKAGVVAWKQALALGKKPSEILDKAITLVEPLIEAISANTVTPPAPPAPSPNGKVVAAAPANGQVTRSVATPSAGGSAIAPPPALAHQREGRPPSGTQEQLAALYRDLGRELGTEVTSLRDVLPDGY